MSETFYITTPIYYVNGLPHIGHAYTTIAADALTRWHRLCGREVRFQTGTDEHGQKVLDKARERGMTPKAHVDDMVQHWVGTWQRLDLAPDHFLRTTDRDHVEGVRTILQRLWDDDLIYRATYTGWYSKSVERFWTEKDLVDGRCPESGQPVEEITEDNYFFRMSRYQDRLIAHIEENPGFIRPASRRNEVLGFLRKPLEDLCISRPKTRMGWGIELPFDDAYVTYVWFDALLNYVTGLGYPRTDAELFERFWPADVQLIGKDILTTHAVYWSTMLMALDLPLPRCLYAHGWWLSGDGAKMSKSLGNTIDVELLVQEFGIDPVRYFFLREIAFGADGGFTYQGFLTRYNADLANDLGNLAHRALTMTSKWLGGRVPAWGADRTGLNELEATARSAFERYASHLDELQFNRGLEAIWEVVAAGNKFLDTRQPWALNREGRLDELQTVMRAVLEICFFAASALLPLMPHKMVELLERLGRTEAHGKARVDALRQGVAPLAGLAEGATIRPGDPLFPRFTELPAAIAALFEAEEPPAPKARPEKAKAKKAPQKSEAPLAYEDFAKVALRTGRILEASPHPNADRLLVLKVDIGEDDPRQIVAGLASRFSPAELTGQGCVVVANLAPAKIRGVVSQGMILAAGAKEVLGLVAAEAEPGEVVK